MKNIDQENESYVLPSNNEELKSFIFKYKVDMTEQVISSIEFAIKHKLPIAEIFQFKGSKFVVTVSPKEFDCNLENIYKYYIKSEQYELCERVIKLREKLRKKPNEKTKNSATGTHCTTTTPNS